MVDPYKGPEGSYKVLVVDDEEVIRLLVHDALVNDFCIAMVESAEEAVPYLVHQPPDVLLVDKNLPGMSGIDLLRQAKALQPECEVMVITGYASLESSIEALRLGAYDYLLKPFDDVEIVVEKVRRAGEKKDMARERRELNEQVMAANKQLRSAHERLKKSYIQTLSSMITALEARDSYTRGHSDRVADYTAMIGKAMGITGESFNNLVDGARLHDLGKIGIRETVLHKTCALTDEEYAHIKTHPSIGADIIGKMEAYRHLVPMVRHHHERFDGKGYPDGLSGKAIPLQARIIAVADSFDAMTSERPYRKTRTPNEALKEIREVAGTQLDPMVVKTFLGIQAQLDTVLAKSS
jgi:response regulator RpfG family c-di-GMP phosphodiesterase